MWLLICCFNCLPLFFIEFILAKTSCDNYNTVIVVNIILSKYCSMRR